MSCLLYCTGLDAWWHRIIEYYPNSCPNNTYTIKLWCWLEVIIPLPPPPPPTQIVGLMRKLCINPVPHAIDIWLIRLGYTHSLVTCIAAMCLLFFLYCFPCVWSSNLLFWPDRLWKVVVRLMTTPLPFFLFARWLSNQYLLEPLLICFT